MKMRVQAAAMAAGLALVWAGSASAALITVESKSVPAGTSAVELNVSISGGENISSLALTIVVGDGGSVLGGSETVSITGFSLTGGIFAGLANSSGFGAGLEPPVNAATIFNVSFTGDGVNVPADGLIGVLSLDISSRSAGDVVTIFPTDLSVPTAAANSEGVELGLEFANGSVTIEQVSGVIPEPATMTLMGLVGLAGLARRRRAAR
jgi:hypothetical protein